MNEEISCTNNKQKRLRVDGKFFKPYKSNCFSILVNLFKERYISSVKSYEYLSKVVIKV